MKQYEDAILGVQSGSWDKVASVVNDFSPADKAYKDRLWALFRTASAQLRINSQLDSVIQTETGPLDEQSLDDYSTMYSSELTSQDCQDLKQKLRQAAPATFQLHPTSTTGHLDF